MRSMILMLLASIAIQQGNQRLKKHYMREGVVAALKKRGYEDVEGKEMNKLLHIYETIEKSANDPIKRVH